MVVIRLRGKDGMFRYNVEEEDAILVIKQKLAEQLKKNVEDLIIGIDPAQNEKLEDDTQTIKERNLKNGQMIYYALKEKEVIKKVEVEKTINKEEKKENKKETKEDEAEEEEEENKLWMFKDESDSEDEEEDEENTVEDETKENKKKEIQFSGGKTLNENKGKEIPKQITFTEYQQLKNANKLYFEIQRHAVTQKIHINEHILTNFGEYVVKTGFKEPRMGYVYGTTERLPKKNVSKKEAKHTENKKEAFINNTQWNFQKGEAHFIYEPLQRYDTKKEVVIEKKDINLKKVDRIAKMFGYKRIGWIITDPNTMTMSTTTSLKPFYLKRMIKMQEKYGEEFVTLILRPYDVKVNHFSVEAVQASKFAVELHKKSLLSYGGDKVKSQEDIYVSANETQDSFETGWFFAHVAIAKSKDSPWHARTNMCQTRTNSVAPKKQLQTYLDRQYRLGSPFVHTLCDINVLVYAFDVLTISKDYVNIVQAIKQLPDKIVPLPHIQHVLSTYVGFVTDF